MKTWKLVQRYITGNAGTEEIRQLKHWMDQDPENEKFVRELKQIWELSPEEEFHVDVQKAWTRLSKNTIEKEHNKPIHPSISKPHKKWMTVFRAAAVILVIFFAGLFSRQYLVNDSGGQEKNGFYVMEELVTAKGEKAKVTFSDGTEVILNGSSSLRFPKKFQGNNREVHLDGEAYFKVAHDPGHPFIVKAQSTEVEVLGTEFNVQGWSEDSHIDVAVREGKVSVEVPAPNASGQQRSKVILNKGQFTRVNKGKGITPAKDVRIENYLLWTRGGLHFDNVRLVEVFRQIERSFDVQISVNDRSILKVPFTSTFRDAELSEVLQVLAATMEMEYTREGSEIKFKVASQNQMEK